MERLELELISIFTLAAGWLIVIGLTLRIVMRRPPVGVSLAWLAVIFSVPLLGAFIYLLFGEKRLGRRRGAVAAANQAAYERWLRQQAAFGLATAQLQSVAYVPLARQAAKVLGQGVMPGNSMTLLSDYVAFFTQLLADIAAARHSVDLAFYIWHEGGWADAVGEALVAATQRGVCCRVLVDAVGAKAFLRGEQAARLRREGVILTAALPASLLSTFAVRADLRNHRKLAVIDHAIAYTGSQNLVDPRYFKRGAGVGEWVDAMVRVVGPAATLLSGVFAVDWAIETRTAFVPPPPPPFVLPGGAIQVAPSGPDLHPGAMHQLLLAALYSAERELVLTTPYFVPDEAIVTALISAAQRGVAVSLVVPLRNDSKLVQYASASQYDELLAAGVRIYRYAAGLLHTKSLTLDGALSMFGSVNLDARSLWLNFEISLLLYDAAFTATLRALQQRYLEVSLPLDLAEWRQRPRHCYLIENCCRLLGPLL
ncbi:MAG: cardiolipin synthase [Pseudomonadales bacterium]|jgi:cardiolipin synthase|nr:cardiolipin synthase [Pseudomonadales bacterium]